MRIVATVTGTVQVSQGEYRDISYSRVFPMESSLEKILNWGRSVSGNEKLKFAMIKLSEYEIEEFYEEDIEDERMSMSDNKQKDILIKYIDNLRKDYLDQIIFHKNEVKKHGIIIEQLEAIEKRIEKDISELETQCMNVQLDKLK